MRTLNRLLLAGFFAMTPLAVMAADDAPTPEPQVTIHTEGDKTIQEYRQNGFLYAIAPVVHQRQFTAARAEIVRQRFRVHLCFG